MGQYGEGMSGHSAIVYNGGMIIYGGNGNLLRYDIHAGSWASLEAGAPSTGHSVCTYNIYVMMYRPCCTGR